MIEIREMKIQPVKYDSAPVAGTEARSVAFNETDCSILLLLPSWLWYFHFGAAYINSL